MLSTAKLTATSRAACVKRERERERERERGGCGGVDGDVGEVAAELALQSDSRDKSEVRDRRCHT